MAKLFQGEYRNGIDGKGRVSIPAGFRRILEANDPEWKPGENPRLVVLFGTPNLDCLEVYSVKAMDAILEKIAALNPRSDAFRAAARMIATRSQDFQLDDNGRVTLPKSLLAYGGMDYNQKAVFAGMVTKFEIWRPEKYLVDTDKNLDNIENDPEVRSTLAELGLF